MVDEKIFLNTQLPLSNRRNNCQLSNLVKYLSALSKFTVINVMLKKRRQLTTGCHFQNRKAKFLCWGNICYIGEVAALVYFCCKNMYVCMFYFTKVGRAKPLEFGTNVHSNKNKYYIHFQMYTQTKINMFLHRFPLFIYTSMYNSRFSLFFCRFI